MGKGYDVMVYWDCPMCQTKKILGTERNCPNCGMPRGEDVKFYMDGPEVKLTEEQQKKKGKGADWMCEYCGGYNSALDTVCVSCGAERSGKDYFEVRKAKEKKQAEKQADMPLNQIYNLILALRFAVAEIEPDGNGQAELSRHDFRVIARQLFLLY